MGLESNIFQKTIVNIDKLKAYGFQKSNAGLTYEKFADFVVKELKYKHPILVENGENFFRVWFDHQVFPENERNQPFVLAYPDNKI